MSSQGREVEFPVGERTARGYLVGEGEGSNLPGLVLVHEWWGLDDHIKDIASRFARSGYVVLAPDLYGGKSTKDPEEAGKLMQALDQGAALETLGGAVEHLKSLPEVDADRIGATGFCMGGTFALLLAIHNPSVKASAPFYGDVPDEETLRGLKAPILFIGAENDYWITQDKLDRLKGALQKYGKEGEVKVYGGAGHAFFNDTRPDAYNKEAAQDAWQSVQAFLSTHLRRAGG